MQLLCKYPKNNPFSLTRQCLVYSPPYRHAGSIWLARSMEPMPPSPEDKRKPPLCLRRCVIFVSCCFSLLTVTAIVIVILGFTVFKKKDPTITVNSVSITGVSPKIDFLTFSFDFNLTLSVDSTVHNPNRVTFKHYPGTVDIFYKDTEIGYVNIDEGTVPGRGLEEVKSNLTLTLDSFAHVNLTMALISDLMGDEISFNTTARIPGKVMILGFIKKDVVATADCHIVIAIPELNINERTCSGKTYMWDRRGIFRSD